MILYAVHPERSAEGAKSKDFGSFDSGVSDQISVSTPDEEAEV
jgi:hypothetical protein